jgi:hypothetical protein
MRRGHWARWSALFTASLVIAAPLVSASPVGASAPRSQRPGGHVSGPVRHRTLASPVPANWLEAFNYYRRLATPGLPDVEENVGTPTDNYTYWAQWHARYMVETQTGIDHQETNSPATAPWYHVKGNDSAANSNLAWTTDITADARWAIEGWMSAPFHGLQMLDPRLLETGFGLKHKNNTTGLRIKTAAGVDIGHDDDNAYGGPYPITWPGTNKILYIDRYTQSEVPNPFGQGTCAHYDGTQAPADHTGPPIYLIYGPGPVVELEGSSFAQGATSLPHCAFDGSDYGGPFGTQMQELNATFLFPLRPLKSEKQYTVMIDTSAGTKQWSFRMGDILPPTQRINRPRQNSTVDQDRFGKIVGTSGADTTRVDVAIAHVKNSRCSFMKGNGDLTARRNCFQQLWLRARGRTDWSYNLPRKLAATFNPRTGAQNGFYYVFARGRDEVGNIQDSFKFGRNYMAFHVVP